MMDTVATILEVLVALGVLVVIGLCYIARRLDQLLEVARSIDGQIGGEIAQRRRENRPVGW